MKKDKLEKEYRCVGGPQHGNVLTKKNGEANGYILYKLDSKWSFPYYWKPQRKILVANSVVEETDWSGDHVPIQRTGYVI